MRPHREAIPDSAVKPDPGAVKSKDREPAKCYASVKLPRSTPTTRRRVLRPDDRRSANNCFYDDRERRYDKDCFHDNRERLPVPEQR